MANGNNSIGEDMLKVLRSIDAKLGQLVRQSGAASVDVADDQISTAHTVIRRSISIRATGAATA
jgi:hypothetical protein